MLLACGKLALLAPRLHWLPGPKGPHGGAGAQRILGGGGAEEPVTTAGTSTAISPTPVGGSITAALLFGTREPVDGCSSRERAIKGPMKGARIGV